MPAPRNTTVRSTEKKVAAGTGKSTTVTTTGTVRRRQPAALVKPPSLLESMIPKPKVGMEYVSREVRGVKDLDLLAYCRQLGRHVLIYGPTGPGKTMVARAFCAKGKIPMATINANGALDPNTFYGLWVPNADGSGYHWEYSDIVEVIRAGHGTCPAVDDPDATCECGVLLINELNFMHPKVTAALHSLLDDQHNITIMEKGNEIVEAGPHFLCIGSYNPDYEGTRPLNKAWRNRYSIKIHWDYDYVVEGKLTCMAVTLELARKLRGMVDAGEIETPISTNMLIEFEEIGIELGAAFAIENFVAAFAIDEQEPVRVAVNAHKTAIEAQLAVLTAEEEDES